MSNFTEGLITKIESRYNPEADIPGPYLNPIVSITEWELLEIIKDMRTEIAILQEERSVLSIGISSLNDRITYLESRLEENQIERDLDFMVRLYKIED